MSALADARERVADFLGANADSLAHALRIAAESNEATAATVAADSAVVADVFRQSAASRRALAVEVEAMADLLWRAEYPAEAAAQDAEDARANALDAARAAGAPASDVRDRERTAFAGLLAAEGDER